MVPTRVCTPLYEPDGGAETNGRELLGIIFIAGQQIIRVVFC